MKSRATESSERREDSRNFTLDTDEYRRKQIEMLSDQLPIILLADIVAGSFLFVILNSFNATLWSYLWLVSIIATTMVRTGLVFYQRQHLDDVEGMKFRWKFLILGSLVSGMIWGSAWVLLPANPSFAQIVIVAFWLAGLGAASASLMAVIKEVFFAYTVPASMLFVGYVLFRVDEDKLLLIGSYLTYLGFIVPIALRVNRDFNRAIRLQLNTATLQNNLQQQVERLKDKEEQLIAQTNRAQELQSEKEAADEKLKAAAEERLLLLDTVGEGIFGLNSSGDITFINSSALKMLQLQESDVLGHSALNMIGYNNNDSTVDRAAYLAITRCFKDGTPVENMDSVLARKDREYQPVRFSCKPIRKGEAVIGAVVSFSDISKQQEMEAMLLQSHKMEAIGRLTGGVSHDFNNLLTVIMGNLQFLKKRLTEDEKATKLVDKIMAAARGGADLNNRLLSFSREQTLEIALVNVGDLLQEMYEFLDRLLGENILLELTTGDENCAVLTDRTQLENAILNLGVNARDAMPEGGKLSISVSKVRLANSYVQHEDSKGEGSYVEIRVTDNGVGIPEAIRKQIFEPFFTTKELNRGTGLGLSTVYGFIRQSGGNITLDSSEGEGTAFKLYLPVAEGVAIEQPVVQQPVKAPQYYQGTILVVEDDDRVRELAVAMLEDAGFDVITAGDGHSGLAQFKACPQIDLVFSDVVMPGAINGIEMAEQILKLKPATPILLASGYAEKSLKDQILEISNVVFVPKPYDTDELPAVMHSMMMGQQV